MLIEIILVAGVIFWASIAWLLSENGQTTRHAIAIAAGLLLGAAVWLLVTAGGIAILIKLVTLFL
jgi:hypothetical protein